MTGYQLSNYPFKTVLAVKLSFLLVLLFAITQASAATTVSIGNLASEPGETVTAPVLISNVEDYGAGTIRITYDPSVVHVTSVYSGPDSTVDWDPDNTSGIVIISAWNTGGVSGDVIFANVMFNAVGSAGSSTPLNISVTKLEDIFYYNITAIIENGSFSIETGGDGNPGAGCHMATKYYGTINGGIYFEQYGWMQFGSMTKTFSDVPCGIKIARVYTGVWGGSPGKGGNFSITVNGATSPTYPACDPCPDATNCEPYQHLRCNTVNMSECHDYVTGCNVHFISYNATPYIVPGSNTVTVETAGNTNCPRGRWDGRIYLIALLVVYEDASMSEMTYWINEGAPYMEKDSACDGPDDHLDISFYFNATHISNPAKVKYWTLGCPHLANASAAPAYTKLNGNDIGEYDHKENYGGYEVLYRWDNIPVSYLNPSSNLFCYHDPNPEYERVNVAVLTLEKEAAEKPDLTITAIKPYHYEWSEGYGPKGDPWFNLENYVNITVMNNGTADAGSFEVKLYADGELIGSKTVDELSAGEVTDVTFDWVPEGEDSLSWTDTAEGAICTYTDTSREYTLRAVVDEDDEIVEEEEENNELTKEQKVVWNGYTADQPLENYVHGEVEGGIIYTTGDGQYRGRFTDGTEYGTYYDVNYDDLEIPGDVKLARLYIYHTWSKPDYTAPKIGVTLKTPSDSVHELSMEKSYNDIKGDFGAWRYVWGTYAYDITEYVQESGTYIVNLTNVNDGSDSDFATEYAIAAPAILVVYEDTTMPKREYWINEGADILLGGRRGDGGFLSREECKNTATFDGEHLDLEVERATLAVVSPWGEDYDNVLYFNEEELGEGVYSGCYDPCSEEEEGISMIIGANGAQVGIAAFDVTDDLEDEDNEVIQGDDGDNMMPTNAFLVITYEEEEYPSLSITASPTEVINCTATDVLFAVESAGTPIGGATVTVNGCGVDESETTNETGQVAIEINCTITGTITATASKDEYTSATTTIECKSPPSPEKVVINEFVSKLGITQTSEWIELYNPTGGDVALDGWTIEDGAGNSLADLNGEIVPANDYLVFNFSNKLNDGGDIIYLNTSTTTVDRVTYGNWDDGNKDDNAPKPGIDNSTGRYPNGKDTDVDAEDFIEFDTPTPGAPNAISKIVISIGTVTGDVTIPIRIDNASNVGAADITVTYNSSVCVITDVTNGSFDVTLANLEHNHEGSVRIGAFQTENPGLNGSIILGNLTFMSNCTNGTSSLNLSVNTLTDATQECNDIPYIVKNGTFISFLFLNGDVNGDGEVTLFDAMYLAKHVLGITGFEEIVEEAADVNGNGEIEISDAMYLAKHVLGITGFEELK